MKIVEIPWSENFKGDFTKLGWPLGMHVSEQNYLINECQKRGILPYGENIVGADEVKQVWLMSVNDV